MCTAQKTPFGKRTQSWAIGAHGYATLPLGAVIKIKFASENDEAAQVALPSPSIVGYRETLATSPRICSKFA
jgi:hypothetical protein